MALAIEELRRESCIRGHHVHKNIWNPAVGELLVCEREPHNATDRYSITITKAGAVVGHLPRKSSKLCSLFLQRWHNTLHSDWNFVINFRCQKFCAFNFRIPAGHPKIFEHRKFSNLQE